LFRAPLNPRQREWRAIASAALDEFPYRLTGERSEGLGRELPRQDEEQHATHRPEEHDQTEHALEPSGHGAERMGRQRGRAEAGGRAVARPVLPHREVEAAVTDQDRKSTRLNARP